MAVEVSIGRLVLRGAHWGDPHAVAAQVQAELARLLEGTPAHALRGADDTRRDAVLSGTMPADGPGGAGPAPAIARAIHAAVQGAGPREGRR